jgi:hypothetical protein
MSTVTSLKKEVFELKKQVNPPEKKHIIITIGLTVEQQKKHYAALMADTKNDFMKDPAHPFHSLESFLDYHKDNKLEEIHVYA